MYAQAHDSQDIHCKHCYIIILHFLLVKFILGTVANMQTTAFSFAVWRKKRIFSSNKSHFLRTNERTVPMALLVPKKKEERLERSCDDLEPRESKNSGSELVEPNNRETQSGIVLKVRTRFLIAQNYVMSKVCFPNWNQQWKKTNILQCIAYTHTHTYTRSYCALLDEVNESENGNDLLC